MIALNRQFKKIAYAAYNRALGDGTLKRPGRCGRCRREATGRVRIHGHHDDYAQPFAVRWLCGRCHAMSHRGHDGRRVAFAQIRPSRRLTKVMERFLEGAA